MITMEYDFYGWDNEKAHRQDRFKSEKNLQDFLKRAMEEMDIRWNTMVIVDEDGSKRVAKIVLEKI